VTFVAIIRLSSYRALARNVGKRTIFCFDLAVFRETIAYRLRATRWDVIAARCGRGGFTSSIFE